MPSVSIAQRRFFGRMEHNPAEAEKRGVHMTHEQMHDFAATKEKGLPAHVEHAADGKVATGRRFYGFTNPATQSPAPEPRKRQFYR